MNSGNKSLRELPEAVKLKVKAMRIKEKEKEAGKRARIEQESEEKRAVQAILSTSETLDEAAILEEILGGGGHCERHCVALTSTDPSLNTPLHMAIAKNCSLEVIESLVSAKSINATNRRKQTPLTLALFSSKPQDEKVAMVELLLKRGAKFWCRLGFNCMTIGSKRNHEMLSDIPLTKMLLKSNRNTTILKADDLKFALQWDLQILELVLEKVTRKDVEATIEKDRCNPIKFSLFLLVQKFLTKDTEIICFHLFKKIATKYMVDVNLLYNNQSLLHHFIYSSSTFNAEAEDKQLHHEMFFDYLLKHKNINVNITPPSDPTATPLAFALKYCEYQIACKLINNRCQVTDSDINQIKFNPGFSGPLVLLLSRGYTFSASFLGKKLYHAQEVREEWYWFQDFVLQKRMGTVSVEPSVDAEALLLSLASPAPGPPKEYISL